MTAQKLSRYRIEFSDFGADQVIPMAFPADTAKADVFTRAETMINQGDARMVRVLDTDTGDTLWTASWQLVSGQLGA